MIYGFRIDFVLCIGSCGYDGRNEIIQYVVPRGREEVGRMRVIMLANMVIMGTYAACVTYAAIHFNDPKILWWYVLLTCIGFSYKTKGD